MRSSAATRREPALKKRAKRLIIDMEARERRRLRERLRLTREARKRALRRISAWAKGKRKQITAKANDSRARCRARIRGAAERQRELVAERAALMRGSAQRRLGKVASARRAELDREIEHQRMLAQRERKKIGTTHRERAAESDDAVRKNIAKGLIPVFDKVRSKIRGGPRRTRTEAFLEWVQEHPDQVLTLQAEVADRDVARLIAEQHEAERRVARGTRVGKGILSAAWRGKTYELHLRPSKTSTTVNTHRLEVRSKGPGVKTFEVSRLLKDDDWTLGRLVSGKVTKEERRAIAAWVDTLDGWNPLDDLSDMTVESGPAPF